MGGSKSKRNEYELLQLEDVHYCSEMKFNIIAIVIEAGLPKFTNGTDQCCNLRLIDETRYETSMSVNFFSDTAQSLPHVPPGDIILLRNVTVCSSSSYYPLLFLFLQLYHSFLSLFCSQNDMTRKLMLFSTKTLLLLPYIKGKILILTILSLINFFQQIFSSHNWTKPTLLSLEDGYPNFRFFKVFNSFHCSLHNISFLNI